MTVLIRLASAGVRFGATVALRDVNLQLERGQRLALVGANGSGKTTLLRVLHGLVPTQGERSVHALAPGERLPRMAMLFQRPFLLNLSVRRNLLVALWLAGAARAERRHRCELALQRVGLAREATRPALALSGGQQQRLALARAWALQPDILFLDEPTASLDPVAKREVEHLVADFGSDGMTVVMSTHNLGQAKRLATHVGFLDAGELVALDSVDRFFGTQQPLRAAAFLKGENPWHS